VVILGYGLAVGGNKIKVSGYALTFLLGPILLGLLVHRLTGVQKMWGRWTLKFVEEKAN
jgi:uncharacterized membrane protein AbrB (regulator of aidB expression)